MVTPWPAGRATKSDARAAGEGRGGMVNPARGPAVAEGLTGEE